MKPLHIPQNSPIYSLYIEFISLTSYVHSIRKINDTSRYEPYEPSMFIYSFFTFNTLYNIDWTKTKAENYTTIIFKNDGSELSKINSYIYFITHALDWRAMNNLSEIFRDSIIDIISKYLLIQGNYCEEDAIIDWIQECMSYFILSPDSDTNNKQARHFTHEDIDNFKNYLYAALSRFGSTNKLTVHGLKQIIHPIYFIRCNLFHGAKTPNLFEHRKQKERFVIYAAILAGINQMLFYIISKSLGQSHK